VPTSSTPWPSLFTKHLQNGTGVLSSSPINFGSRKRCGLHFDGVVTAWTLRALEVALAGGCSNLNTVDKNRLSRYELSKLLIEKGIRIKSLDSKSLYHPSDADKVAGAVSIKSVFVPSLLNQMGLSAKENITNWAAPYLDRHMKFPQRTLVVYNLGTLDNDIERANANCFLSNNCQTHTLQKHHEKGEDMSLLDHSLGDGSKFRCSPQTSSSTHSDHNCALCWGDDTPTNGL